MAYNRLVEKLTKENLWLYIIYLLKKKPMYGYEIVKHIREKFNFSPALIPIYVVLYKMEREKLIRRVKNGDSFQNLSRRNYYIVTKKGLEIFNKGLEFIRQTYEKLADKNAYKA